jgi:hypothetical protein
MGQTGAVFYATGPEGPQVVSFAPVGAFTAAISNAEIVFNTPMLSSSLGNSGVSLTAPGGSAVSLSFTPLSLYRFQISFPAQTAQGDYTLIVGPPVHDLTGQPMLQAYTNRFSIVWAVVRGSIRDPNGVPVPGVLLQPDGGVPATNTDSNGNYVLGLPPVGTIKVVPSKTSLMFAPPSRSYANVTWSISTQDYLSVSTYAPALTTQVHANGIILNWYGISGVTYQTLYSTNLATWWFYGAPITGTNGPAQFFVPLGTEPRAFFRMRLFY